MADAIKERIDRATQEAEEMMSTIKKNREAKADTTRTYIPALPLSLRGVAVASHSRSQPSPTPSSPLRRRCALLGEATVAVIYSLKLTSTLLGVFL